MSCTTNYKLNNKKYKYNYLFIVYKQYIFRQVTQNPNSTELILWVLDNWFKHIWSDPVMEPQTPLVEYAATAISDHVMMIYGASSRLRD